MHVLVINNHSIHIGEIHKLFPLNTFFTYISYRQIGGYDVRPFDCILLTGSSTHTYAYKAFAQEIHLLKSIDKPIIGICLGCELIASGYECVITKHNERIEGDLQIASLDDPTMYTVHEAHKYAITTLGNDMQGLAKSDYGFEIIKHKTKSIIGFQFHPEVTLPSNDGLRLFMKYAYPLIHSSYEITSSSGESS